MSRFDDWLSANGKVREYATAMDEIQWLREERKRLRFTDQEREAILKLRKWAMEIAGDNAFVDQVCDAADEAAMAMDSLLERHK